MKFLRLSAACGAFCAALIMSGCVFAPVVPPRGVIYTDQKAPLFGGGETGSKTGEAHAHNVLFLVGWGDSGLKAAMDDGDITKLRHTDYRIENYLLFYQRYTTIAYGE